MIYVPCPRYLVFYFQMSLFARWTIQNAEMTKPCFQNASGILPSPYPTICHPVLASPVVGAQQTVPLPFHQHVRDTNQGLPRPVLLPSTPYSNPPSCSSSLTGNSPVWMEGSGLSEQDEQIILDHLGSSIRESTRKTYTSYWVRFKTFCAQKHVSAMPASPAVIARFLIYIAELNASVAGSKISVSAIAFYHKMFLGESVAPTESVVVKNVMKALSEKFAKPVKKAKVFTSLNLKDLLDFHFNQNSKEDETIVIMIAVMFCLMARHEEISKLTSDCVKVLDSEDVEVSFPSAKNYNFADSKKSFLASCPNAKYNIAKIFADYASSCLPGTILFPYSYNSALCKMRQVLSKANIVDAQQFSLHSFRVGAVSEAANGGLVSDSDIQRHARWNSLEMVYRYRCQTLENQLKASRILLISRI